MTVHDLHTYNYDVAIFTVPIIANLYIVAFVNSLIYL